MLIFLRALSILQFPLLYCITVVAGLVVYGSDFDSSAGQIYLGLLLLIPVVHFVVKKNISFVNKGSVQFIINLSGLIFALLAYRQLQFDVWDEHNLPQAIYLALLGLCSYLVAAKQVPEFERNNERNNKQQLVSVCLALVVIGGAWCLSSVLPMSSLFVIACIFIFNLIWSSGNTNATDKTITKQGTAIFQLLFFVLMMGMGVMIWDYQLNMQWAAMLSISFLTGAVMFFIAAQSEKDLSILIVLLIGLNTVVSFVWPAFVLSVAHALLLGVCLGWLLLKMLLDKKAIYTFPAISISIPLLLGFITGYLFSANLEYNLYRFLFVVTILFLVLVKLLRRSPHNI